MFEDARGETFKQKVRPLVDFHQGVRVAYEMVHRCHGNTALWPMRNLSKQDPPHNKLTSCKILSYALRVGTGLSASPSTFRQFSIHIGRLGYFEGAVCWNLRESTNIANTPIILAVMADNWCTNKDSTISFTAPTGIPLSNGESSHIYYCIHHYLVV